MRLSGYLSSKRRLISSSSFLFLYGPDKLLNELVENVNDYVNEINSELARKYRNNKSIEGKIKRAYEYQETIVLLIEKCPPLLNNIVPIPDRNSPISKVSFTAWMQYMRMYFDQVEKQIK